MNEELKASVVEHAKREYPREACGVIVILWGKERYFPCRNLSKDETQFVMCPEDFARSDARGEVVAIVHSHCNVSPDPSQADLVACETSGLPWHIVSIPTETWRTIRPTGYKAPLVGRQFSYGILDCYTLVRDWYRENRGVELLDFDRDEDEWWKHGKDFYMENFSKAGFRSLRRDGPKPEPLEVGDVFLIQHGGPVASHAAIYLGENVILHHLRNRLSSRDIYGGFWQKNTRAVVRYVGA